MIVGAWQIDKSGMQQSFGIYWLINIVAVGMFLL